MDTYRPGTEGPVLRYSILDILNQSVASLITDVYFYDPGDVIAGGERGGGALSEIRNPALIVIPASMAVISPTYWFTAIADSPPIAPGGYGQWAFDQHTHNERAIINAFNEGNLKVGIILADGHSYIAAVPDVGATAGMLSIALIVLGCLKHRHWVTARKS